MNQRAAARGFTLIEILVSLAIVGVALIAGLRATAALSNNAQRQTDLMLAQLCVDNELIRLRLSRQLTGVGESRASCVQADQRFDLVVVTHPTPNPDFFRVEVKLEKAGMPVLQNVALMERP